MRVIRQVELTGFALLILMVLSGVLCNYSDAPPDYPEAPGLRVRVVDALTGELIETATVSASEGSTNETLTDGTSVGYTHRYVGVYRSGTFSITVAADGYQGAVIGDIWIPSEAYAYQDYVPVDVLVRLSPVQSSSSTKR